MPSNAKDLYTQQLLKLDKGTPLYQPCAVEVGDVGFVDPLDGDFQKLYNIANPPRSSRPGRPPSIQLKRTRREMRCSAYHVCLPRLSCSSY